MSGLCPRSEVVEHQLEFTAGSRLTIMQVSQKNPYIDVRINVPDYFIYPPYGMSLPRFRFR